MTIAKPIQTLEFLRDRGVFPFNTKEGVLYTVESIDVAISTMHKYEKIEQIIKDCNECDLVNDYALDEIKEVIENGNEG